MTSTLHKIVILPEPLELFGQSIAQAPFGAWAADRNGKVVLFNEILREFLGIDDPEEVLGRHDIFKDHVAAAQGLVPYIKRVLNGETIETVVMLDAGKVHYLRCLYFPINDAAGNPAYVGARVENVTAEHEKPRR